MAIDRPLKLGELVAETVRLYGERIWAAVSIAFLLAGALLAASVVDHLAAFVVIVALAFTVAYAVAARIVCGDALAEAWAQVGVRVPVLLALTVVVSVPFVLGIVDVVILFFSVAWLAFVGLAIPVAMLERPVDDTPWYGRIAYALTRASELARAEYLHMLGVSAALVLAYALLGPALAVLLTGFADNGSLAASVIASAVIGPFFFLGLSVLYFEQRARALSSPRNPQKTWEAAMPKYLMLSTLSEQGLQTLRANPERVREVNKDVEELGVKVLHQWFVLGPHDFVNIVEAPDATAIAKVSVALGARGSIHTESYEMLEVDQLLSLLES